MLANQVNPARRRKDCRLGLKARKMLGTENGRIMHVSEHPYMDSISTTMGQKQDSPGAKMRDHGPACANESTGAVAGSSATHICFGPGRSGQPP
jgi:hypothetical protein